MLIACVFLFLYFFFVYAAIEIFSMNKVDYNWKIVFLTASYLALSHIRHWQYWLNRFCNIVGTLTNFVLAFVTF